MAKEGGYLTLDEVKTGEPRSVKFIKGGARCGKRLNNGRGEPRPGKAYASAKETRYGALSPLLFVPPDAEPPHWRGAYWPGQDGGRRRCVSCAWCVCGVDQKPRGCRHGEKLAHASGSIRHPRASPPPLISYTYPRFSIDDPSIRSLRPPAASQAPVMTPEEEEKIEKLKRAQAEAEAEARAQVRQQRATCVVTVPTYFSRWCAKFCCPWPFSHTTPTLLFPLSQGRARPHQVCTRKVGQREQGETQEAQGGGEERKGAAEGGKEGRGGGAEKRAPGRKGEAKRCEGE